MRIDLLSIFPQYFAALDLSLMGKARQSGQLDIHVHDLRSWTHDRHRTVDDTPYGGGAGMVMRPDVWGEALDTVIGAEPGKCVLAIPTPSRSSCPQALGTVNAIMSMRSFEKSLRWRATGPQGGAV